MAAFCPHVFTVRVWSMLCQSSLYPPMSEIPHVPRLISAMFSETYFRGTLAVPAFRNEIQGAFFLTENHFSFCDMIFIR